MFKHRHINAEVWPFALIVVFGCLFFADILFFDHVLFALDNLSITVPGKSLFYRTLTNGKLPLWNPYLFSGIPFLADINLGLLSPFTLFFAVFSPFRALTLSVVSSVLVAGGGMYLFSRSLNLSRWACLITAVIFMFSGTLATYINNTAIINTVAWLPLLFYFQEKLYLTKKVEYATYSAIVLAFMAFGGHIQYFYYAVIFSAAYIISRHAGLKEKVSHVFFTYIPALLLSAVQIVPFLEYSGFSTRPEKSFPFASAVPPFVSNIRFLLPNFFGIMKDGTSWGAIADINGYTGLIGPLLALFAVLNLKNKKTLFFAIIALVSLFLSLGKYSPLYFLAFHIVPFFSRFRTPEAILILYTFSIAVLAGMGADRLAKSVKNNDSKLKHITLSGMVAGISGIMATVYMTIASYSPLLYLLIAGNLALKTPFISTFLNYAPLRMNTIFALWTNNIMAASAAIFMFSVFVGLSSRMRCMTAVHKTALLLLVAAELMVFAGNPIITTREDNLHIPNELAKLFRNEKTTYRIMTITDGGAKPPFADPVYFEHEAIKAFDYLQPNINSLIGVESIGGYASIVTSSYSAYLTNVKQNDPTGLTLPDPGSPRLDELGVKYIITGGRLIKELESILHYQHKLTFMDRRINRTFTVFENKNALPRAFFRYPDSEDVHPVQTTAYESGRIKISARTNKKARLTVTIPKYPGWHVKINGKEAAIGDSNIFLEASIPHGASEIEFYFMPKLWMAAAAVSAVNWLYLFGFLIFAGIQKQKYIRKQFHIRKSQIQQNP